MCMAIVLLCRVTHGKSPSAYISAIYRTLTGHKGGDLASLWRELTIACGVNWLNSELELSNSCIYV